MMKNYFIIIFFLFFIPSFLFAEDPTSDIWGDYKILIKRSIYSSEYIFLPNSNKENSQSFYFDKNILYSKGIKIGKAEIYLIADHSGGESGGFYNINLLYKEKDLIKKVSIDELSGYLNFEISDINGDGENEIIVDSNKCYDMKIKFKEIIKDEILLTQGFYMGIIGPYKDIYSFENGKIKEVTLVRKYNSYTQTLFIETEKKLKSLKDSRLSLNDYQRDQENIIEIIQYLYYMAKAGKKFTAIRNIKNAGLIIFYETYQKEISFALSGAINENIKIILGKNKGKRSK